MNLKFRKPLKIPFYKFHGTGNDFILINNRENEFVAREDLISRMCHRRFGIGADGLILLEKAPGYDFGMHYYNSDGKESTMCGNGGRCIVALADFLSLTGNDCRFKAIDGPHRGKVLHREGNNWQVSLQMADVAIIENMNDEFVLNTGSPHLVTFADNVSTVDVDGEGRAIRNREVFKSDGINVNFAEIRDDGLFVRTYERGVEAETLSCGTGVTASAIAFAIKSGCFNEKVKVSTPGGVLAVRFEYNKLGHFSSVLLEGPATLVFVGETDTNYYL